MNSVLFMKSHSEFVCQQCGYKSASFLGKCPQCGEWNSLVETSVSGERSTTNAQRLTLADLVRLSEVKSQKMSRIPTGFSEFDRVLGGGIVPGSIVLISGEPGIGKSTLLLQCALRIASVIPRDVGRSSAVKRGKTQNGTQNNAVLYVTGEESAQQVKIRADRLISSQLTVDSSQKRQKQSAEATVNREQLTDNLYILPQTDVEMIAAAADKITPRLVIIDSIQTLTFANLSGSAGSVGQVRECAQILQRRAKASGIPFLLVGHVTKEGNIAGPKVLEHLVDAVLAIEGDSMHQFRLLRPSKNRFGSTFEVGVFEMRDAGMVEVSDPSQIFLAQRMERRAGSVVTSTVAGGRPILAEVQALCTSTLFGMPARRVTGLDFARMQIVIATLAHMGSYQLGNLDIYLNMAGGLRTEEPAADLAAALAIASAVVDKPVKEGVCAFGEVGLLGELRPISNVANRIAEAKRLGFGDLVTPERFKTLVQAIDYAIHGE